MRRRRLPVIVRGIVCGTVCASLLLAACGDAKVEGPPDGKSLYVSQGCVTCHSADGSGGVFAPTLHGKKAFWTRPALMEYLRNPQAYAAKDKRLSEQAGRYTLPMTRADKLSPEELGKIADHVLSMP